MSYAGFFHTHSGRQVDKWIHYFDIYDRHMFAYVSKSPRVLEIGIDHGGSLQLWRDYFGAGCEVVGVDIRPECMFEDEGIKTLVGDQTDAAFLASLGEFDIVIDDGSHVPAHQQISFTNLWPKTRGVYLIEDCHDRYPALVPTPELRYNYPWVVVCEKQRRIIRGQPSRALRPDEIAAREAHADP